MEQQNLNSVIMINGELNTSSNGRTLLTADKKAYMRNYMKNYLSNLKINDPEQFAILEHRKYWRCKLKSVGCYIKSNEDLDKLTSDDCHNIYKLRSAKMYMEQKPELFKYI